MNLNVAEIVNVKLYDQLQHAELPAAGTWLSISEGGICRRPGADAEICRRRAESGGRTAVGHGENSVFYLQRLERPKPERRRWRKR